MGYRTKTYIAGDWDGDKWVIEKLYDWNKSGKYQLSFINAHDLTQARDSSLNCSIKKSLKIRLDASKTFVLIVGDQTKNLKAGGCQLCRSYNRWNKSCARYLNNVDYRSFVQYECEIANKDIPNIVVIYNDSKVERTKCPDVLKYVGTHLPAYYYDNGNCYWNYENICAAIDKTK